MAMDPRWSEELTSSGGPTQPLHAGSIRNGFLGDITQALTVDIRLRGRYASVFTWGQYIVENHPSFAESSVSEKKEAIYTLEKLLAVTTLWYQEHNDVESGTSGLVGKERLGGMDLFESDPIDLSAFELRDGTTAVRLSNTNRYYLHLREKDTELGLTGVGEELARSFDAEIDSYRDQIINSLETEKVAHEDLATFVHKFSFQSLYHEPDHHQNELNILTRVFFGLTSWDSEKETAVLDPLPEVLDVRVFPYLQYETGDRQFEDDFRDDVESEILRMQRAWGAFILQVIDEFNDPSSENRYRLDAPARDVFNEFRQIARAYWLQEFAAVLLRQQLWLFCEYLQSALPRPIPREELFDELLTSQISKSAENALNVTVSPGNDSASQSHVARELALYGQTPVNIPTVHRPDSAVEGISTLGILRNQVSDQLTTEWDDAHDSLRTSTLVRSVRQIANQLTDVPPQPEVLNTWQQSLGYSLTLLVMILERYRDMIESTPLIGTYMQAQHSGDRASLPELDSYFERMDDNMSLTSVARKVILELIIAVHERIVRNRLRNDNPLRISFSYDAEQEAFRYMSGTGRLRRDYLRYGLMHQTLLDLNLVTSTGDSAQLTSQGEDLLLRTRRGSGKT